MLFWSRGKNKLGKGVDQYSPSDWTKHRFLSAAALVATLVFKKLAAIEAENNYAQTALEFETLAVQILDKISQNHKGVCSDALVREVRGYSNTTWLELAVAAEAKEFIAHRAVQNALNNIWSVVNIHFIFHVTRSSSSRFGFIDQSVSDTQIIFSTLALGYSGFLPFNDELVKGSEVNNAGVVSVPVISLTKRARNVHGLGFSIVEVFKRKGKRR